MPAGRTLRENGIPDALSRFAETHACRNTAEMSAEDLLVALANTIWKGKRNDDLEQALTSLVSRGTGEETWAIWLRLDDVLTAIAASADERLANQAPHSP